MAGNDLDHNTSPADAARDVRAKASAAARNLGDKASETADQYKKAASAAAQDFGDAAAAKADEVQDRAKGVVDELKDRAAQHAGDARDVVSNIASEARNKIADMVDQQKNAGADQLSILSRAAQNAAGDLDEKSPQVARLVRDAASTVDSLAGDLRSSSLNDVVASVSSFARKQPVAFFAASVLAGFVLARFVKSEPVVETVEEAPRQRRAPRR